VLKKARAKRGNGTWFNEIDADGHATNGYGEVNSIVHT
jgi:hypothetical protein